MTGWNFSSLTSKWLENQTKQKGGEIVQNKFVEAKIKVVISSKYERKGKERKEKERNRKEG